MMASWPQRTGPDTKTSREPSRFEVELLRHGARTRIGRQFISYPFHLTRPFHLDTDIPSLLTLYQQSCSGGLYRADCLSTRLDVREGAAANITTQAATIVHDCRHQPAVQTIGITIGRGAFLAFTPEPLVLFPGACCISSLTADLGPGAVLLLAEAFSWHDPEARSRLFDRLQGSVAIRDETGKVLVQDNYRLQGEALAGPASPIGAWKFVSSYLLAGERARLPRREDIAEITQTSDRRITGASELPNSAGWGIRCLASDAVAASDFGQDLFSLAVRAAFGHAPVPRRK